MDEKLNALLAINQNIGEAWLDIASELKKIELVLEEIRDELQEEHRLNQEVLRRFEYPNTPRPPFPLKGNLKRNVIEADDLLSKLQFWIIAKYTNLKGAFTRKKRKNKKQSKCKNCRFNDKAHRIQCDMNKTWKLCGTIKPTVIEKEHQHYPPTKPARMAAANKRSECKCGKQK